MKKQNGITLIALVITIIVLLILAGVSISYLVGDNGILKKAVIAVQKFNQAQEDENNALNNLGNFDESNYDGEYRLGFVYNDKVKKYFDSEYVANAFFVVGNSKLKQSVFRNHVLFYVAKEANKETWETKDWNNKFTEDVTSGFLCDDKGYPILGWGVDGDTGDTIRSSCSLLNLSYELEGKERIGTEIDSSGYIYAKFSDETKSLIGQIPIAQFFSSNSLTKIEENMFQESLASGQFDGIGIDITSKNVVMKRITRASATEINNANENRKNNNYTLSIDPENNYYFPLYNPKTFESYSKKINLYEGSQNAAEGSITPFSPYIDGDLLYSLSDENGSLLGVRKVDYDTGELIEDAVSIDLKLDEKAWLYPQATTKARLVGNINDNTKTVQLSFYNMGGYKYIALFDIVGTSGIYTLKLNNIKDEEGIELDYVTEAFKNSCSYNLQYSATTEKPNIDSITFNLNSLSSEFEDIDIDISNSKFNNKTNNLNFEIGDLDGQGKGRQASELLKITIKENGRIYGLYDNGEEVLLCAIAVSNSNEGDFDGIGVCPEENYMTISRQ